MKKLDLKNKSRGELEKLLTERCVAWRAFRFGIAGSRITKVREGRAIRRDIARLLTKINEPKH